MTDWYTADSEEAQERLLGAWGDAPLDDLESCEMLLDVAKEQVLAYGPELSDGEPTPARFVLAQLKQAENLWNAGRVSSDGNVGDGAWSYTPRPLDKTIRGIIRPVDGKPHVL
ncbi:MAG TPA: hypothetical protein VNQ48_00215 [Microbacteriaceae bacterium]|nr:hypothetical protein [Microbacteriaceae bacterium]